MAFAAEKPALGLYAVTRQTRSSPITRGRLVTKSRLRMDVDPGHRHVHDTDVELTSENGRDRFLRVLLPPCSERPEQGGRIPQGPVGDPSVSCRASGSDFV